MIDPIPVASFRKTYTVDEALDVIIAWLQGAGFNATSWGPTSLQRKFLRFAGFIYSDLTKSVSALADLCYNETSRGDALTEFSKSHYDNVREAAVKTMGTFVLRKTVHSSRTET
jgi:hypothetical protein